jgi:hypothetical protein
MPGANSGSVQLVATLLSSFLQCLVKDWIFSNVPNICSPDQESHLTCPHNQVFFTASAIWCVLVSYAWGHGLHDSISFDQGPYRPKSTVRSWLDLPRTVVCAHRGCPTSTPFLVYATVEARLVGQIREHANRAAWGGVHTASNGHQLLVLVRSRFRVPVYRSQT